MFNIFEGNADAKALKLQERLELLKRMREDGQFDSEPIKKEEQPEIVADGHGPDDTVRPSPFVAPPLGDDYCPHAVSKSLSCVECGYVPEGERCPNPGGNVAGPAPTHKYYTSQPCNLCDGYTRHISYGTDTPVWHCTVCCTCDFCMAEADAPPGFQTVTDPRVGRAQVAAGHEALHDALTTPADQLFFCTKCGAGLRCGVCNNESTGRYCDLCGRKDTGEGFCTDCWKEEDKNG